MDQDDLPPQKQQNGALDETFSGALGKTFAGFMWVAVFAAIAGLILWGAMRWLG